MQSVNALFTAEESDTVRQIAHNLQVSWKKFSTLDNRTFTIGVSTIGGNDVIGLNPGAVGSPSNYKYFDESSYVQSLAWERGFNIPLGGLTMALAEAQLDNTSGRFLPHYMGGVSELYTAILPRRPMIINAGFDVGGVDITLPQFAGILTKQPRVDKREGSVYLEAADYIDYFRGKKLDQSTMFTGQYTHEVLGNLLEQLGMSTAQYELDDGINLIPFGYFPQGTNFSDIIDQIVQAENGHFYQDEEGIFRFENRQHWQNAPFNVVQRIIYTADVLNAEGPNDDHIINVVEVKSRVRTKQSNAILYRVDSASPIELEAGETREIFINFDDPVISLTVPTSGGTESYFIANTESDNSGSYVTSSITISLEAQFSNAAKFSITNGTGATAYITTLVISGRNAVVTSNIYVRAKDDSSLTAFDERSILIENDFIADESWAQTLAQLLLNDYAEPENLQRITIKAKPSLQMGDLISWQGHYWRVYDIKTRLDTSIGFVQELLLLQRNLFSYFTIGVSTIGGTDQISP